LDLLGIRTGRAGVFWVLLLLAGVVASRCAVLPMSVWDRDEAHLGLAVADFDPAADHPHAPWFPLWVAVGKALDPLVNEPARGLQLAGAALGAWTLLPLAALWAIWMERRLAVLAALLYLVMPGPWFLSGRAYCDTPATFLLLLAAAWWLRPAPRAAELLAGSAAAGLCLLVRPQLGLAVVGMGLWCWLRARRLTLRLALVGPLAMALAVGALGLVAAAGGVAPLRQSLGSHVRYHVDGLKAVEHGFAASGPARALIEPGLAALWVLLALVGVAAWSRFRREVGSPWPLLVTVLAPCAVTVFALSDPSQPRYALPLLALSVGPVAIGLATCLKRLAPAAVAVAVVTSVAVGLPQTRSLRAQPSPVIAALTEAGEEAARRGGLVVVDRTLGVFADYLSAAGGLAADVVTDFRVEIGAVALPPAETTVAVFDRGRGGFVAGSERSESFQCALPWLRRLGPDRFLDVTVAAGARVERVPSRW
jgi:hypothetical protein